MNARLRWLNEIVCAWLDKIEDEVMLQNWRWRITQRLHDLEAARRMPLGDLLAGLRQCKCGDPVYLGNPLARRGTTYTTLYFRRYQPRKKRLWLCVTPGGTKRRVVFTGDPDVFVFNWHDIEHYQIARTEVAVRMRAPKPIAGGPML